MYDIIYNTQLVYMYVYISHHIYIYSTIGICRAVFLESAIISIPGPNISLRVHTPTGIQLPVANQGPREPSVEKQRILFFKIFVQ